MKFLVEKTNRSVNVIKEKRATFLEGLMLSNKPNSNGRVYPQAVLDEAVESVQNRIREGSFYGAIAHSEESSVPLDRASHIITSLTKHRDGYYGRAKIISGSPAGTILESIIAAGGKIGMSSRGFGGLKKTSNGLMEVQSPYSLASIDSVSQPSGRDCWMTTIQEGIKSKKYNLTEAHLGMQLLQEMAPKGSSLADYDFHKFDRGAWGFDVHKTGAGDSRSFPDTMFDYTNSILEKLAELLSKPSFSAQDFQDASNMKAYIATISDPFVRQQIYQAWNDSVGNAIMKQKATEFLKRLGKYNA